MKHSPVRVLHPFFLAIYPMVFLFSHNVVELSLFEQRSVYRIGIPVAINLCLVSLFLVAMKRVYRDRQRAGLVVSLIVFLFFSYGHFHQIIVNNLGHDFLFGIGPFVFADHLFYYGSSALIVGLVLYLLRNPQRNLTSLTRFLNVVSCILVAASLGNVLLHEIQRISLSHDKTTAQQDMSSSSTETSDLCLTSIILL